MTEHMHITRREAIFSVPLFAAAARALAQSTDAPIPVKSLNHMTLSVSDPKRSQEFYQGLFGMPIQARQGALVLLQIGNGTEFVALGGGAQSGKGSINHFCMTTPNFNADRIMKILAEHGVSKAEAPASGGAGGAGGGGLSGGPMKARVRIRGENAGGAKEGTPELYIGDPDGLVVQIQDTSYCGGAGVLGQVCNSREPSPSKGLIALKGLSHFTLTVSNVQQSMAFYQGLFGMPVKVHQGATPLLSVGSTPQFVTLAGGAGPTRPPSIQHVCFTIENFDPDRILKTLESYGIKPRGEARGPVGPLTSYVSMRMPDRGGAKDGTPELYFTDPDGILLQLQDVTYCGGGGKLGEICS